ncbi:heterokaryon incompatibility protein-domain-containing protein [Annulohypoxylon moriforme]|nr:heterokaryon incompatibility protein-domain-containing protein [Annulohypoxylon moriforme]
MREYTSERPFDRDLDAKCRTCIDLNADNLSTKKRRTRDGQYVSNERHEFPLTELEKSAERCVGCHILHQAALTILVDLSFREVEIELDFPRGEPLEGLFIRLSTQFDAYDDREEIDAARVTAGFDVYKVPTEREPSFNFAGMYSDAHAAEEREAYHVKTPKYEIFFPDDGEFQDEPLQPTWTAIKARPLRHEDTSSSSWASNKLMECEHHEGCQRHSNEWALPKRVIDVGDSPGANIRLYESKKGEQKRYVCLSHCWGTADGGEPLKTTSTTLDGFKSCIKFTDLPGTFQDAVVFTRSLGIRYLWIDSLCIVQDEEGEKGDFAIEAPKMVDIYHNAELTLAAADSPNCRGGLFRYKKTRTRICDMSCPRNPARHAGVYVQELPYEYHLVYPHPYDGLLKSQLPKKTSPLIQRAWVFQEFILSRRVLFFTSLEHVWECQACAISESGHTSISHEIKKQLDTSIQKRDRIDDLRFRWHRIVQIFSCLSLTYKTDKLPAIGGLAQRIRSIFGSEYFIGLWEDMFIHNLSWRIHTSDTLDDAKTAPRVPSWSWMKQANPVTYSPGPVLATFCTVEDLICTSPGNRFTQVSDGHAVLSSYLTPMEITRSASLQIKSESIVTFGSEIDYDNLKDGPVWDSGNTLLALPLTAIPYWSQMEAEKHIQIGKPVKISFLVLRPTGCQNLPQPDTFERIGTMEWHLFQCLSLSYFIEQNDLLIKYLERVLKYFKDTETTMMCTYNCVSLKHLYNYDEKADFYDDKRDKASERGLENYPRITLSKIEQLLIRERGRVNEWKRRHENGEEQEHKKVQITLV